MSKSKDVFDVKQHKFDFFDKDKASYIIIYKNCFVTSCSLELSFWSAVNKSDEVKRQA